MASLKAKHYIFERLVEVGCFSIQWVAVFCENVILSVVVLLKNADLWVSFFQMGSCGLFGFNITKKNEKKLFQFFKRGLSRKKSVMWVVGLTDNLILWMVGLNNN